MQTVTLPESFGKEWTVEKELGRGSYGVVYQVVKREGGIETRSAVKVISIPRGEEELGTLRAEGLNAQESRTFFKNVVDGFIEEIGVMQSFRGTQNIVSIEDYKVVSYDGGLRWDIFIRMELLTPLREYMSGHAFSEADVKKLGIDICQALSLCKKKNVIHRDIKPENIFVNEFGSFKLGDFGLAAQLEGLTETLSRRGTGAYMAPEVYSGQKYDERADIYSLGLMLYKLSNNNRFPFLSDKQLLSPTERRAALEKRLSGEKAPPPARASEGLSKVILKACAFDPGDRYSSADEMKRALEAVRDTGEASAASAAKKERKRLPALFFVIVAAAFAGTGAAFAFLKNLPGAVCFGVLAAAAVCAAVLTRRSKSGTAGREREEPEPVKETPDETYGEEPFDCGSADHEETTAVPVGFFKDGRGVRYYENGVPLKGIRVVDGERYYFDPKTGYMAEEDGTVCGVPFKVRKATVDGVEVFRAELQEPDEESDKQAWIRWLLIDDGFSTPKSRMSSPYPAKPHVESTRGCNWEIYGYDPHFHFLFLLYPSELKGRYAPLDADWNKIWADGNDNGRVPGSILDYLVFEFWYREKGSDDPFRRVSAKAHSVFNRLHSDYLAFKSPIKSLSEYSIFRIPTYDAGMTDLHTNGNAARIYETVIIVRASFSNEMLMWVPADIEINDSYELYLKDAVTARIVRAKSGFVAEDGGIRYYKNGLPMTGFLSIGGRNYHFDGKSALMTKDGISVGGVRLSPEKIEADGLTLYAYDLPAAGNERKKDEPNA